MKLLFFKILLSSIFISLLFINKTNAQNMVNGKEVDTTFNTSMNHIFGALDKTPIWPAQGLRHGIYKPRKF